MTARKKRVLTPEEQLEAALVPESEWPYEVPDNWCWVRIGSVNSYKSASVDPSKTPDRLFELYSVPSLEEDYPEIIAGSEIGSTKQSVSKDDILLCKINPRINRVWKVAKYTDETLIASSEWVVIRSAVYEPDFLKRCLSAHFFREQLLSHVSGVGGSLMRAQPRYIKDYAIPLPPLHEQRRIASRIEWLFAKLDDAEAELREVIDGSEQRLATILHKALNGELTANWRSEHSISIEHWQEKTLADVTTRVFDGPFGSHLKTKDYIDSGVRVVRLENLRHLFFDDSKQSYVSEEKYEEIKAHTVVPTDIIMSTFISGDMKVCQLPEYIGFAANKADCIGIRPRHDISTRFLLYVLASNRTFDYLSGLIHGSTRPRVNTRQIRSIPIQLPCMAEQQMIASIIDRAFGNYQRAISSATDALETIGELKAAILAKALRGELGTNDPDEPSSKELLANIISINAGK